jgi:hypothetical protein
VSVRSRTAGVMTTLMRSDRDRRLGKPVKGHAILERMLLVGTRSADHIRASGHSGCIAMEVTPSCKNRPDTWLHPNASQKARFLLHRGRRPYMALSVVRAPATLCLKLRDERTSRGNRVSVAIDLSRPFAAGLQCHAGLVRHRGGTFHTSALALVDAGTVWHKRICSRVTN